MPVNSSFVLHGVVNSSTFISQITDATPSSGVQAEIARASGLPFPLFTGTMNQRPEVNFNTEQVKTVLDLPNALAGIVDLSGANTDLLYKAISDMGTRVADGTTAHGRLRFAKAFLALQSLTAGSSTKASVSCRLGAIYDGTNAIIQATASAALSGTPSCAEHFVAGPVVINTVALGAVQNIDINFGRTTQESVGDGEVWPTFAGCLETAPVLTVRTLHWPWGAYATPIAVTGLSVWLRKMTAATGRVANNVEEHILFSGTKGMAHVVSTTGGGNTPVETTVQIAMVGADATTAPLTLDTTAAIT
jgi:hypothetical protein